MKLQLFRQDQLNFYKNLFKNHLSFLWVPLQANLQKMQIQFEGIPLRITKYVQYNQLYNFS